MKTEESKRLWLEVNEIFFDQPELNNFKCLKIVGQYCWKLEEKFKQTLTDIKKFIDEAIRSNDENEEV